MLRSVNTRLIRASLSPKRFGSCGIRRPQSAFLALLITDRFTWLVACLNGFDQQKVVGLPPGRFSREFNHFSLDRVAQPGYVLSVCRCCSPLMGARKWCYCVINLPEDFSRYYRRWPVKYLRMVLSE